MAVESRRRSATRLPRVLPLLVALALAFGIPVLSVAILRFVGRLAALPPPGAWQWLYLHHGVQFVLTLAAIAVVRRFVRADYGLHLPRGKSYVGVALIGGAGFSLIACAVMYGPSLLAHTSPSLGYAPTTGNVIGWLTFEGLYVGATEETLFRALLVTYLAATIPGRVELLGRDLSLGGVLAAAIFGLSHWNYGVLPFPLALGQQVYAFALGLLYAYCFEKSGSIVAPVLAHNISDLIPTALGLLLVSLVR